MKSISRFTLLALAAALVTSCSGNSSSTKGGTVDDNTFLTGYVGASDISLSKVHAVPLDYEGQPDTDGSEVSQRRRKQKRRGMAGKRKGGGGRRKNSVWQ